jgi:hypothetical protein
MRLNDGWTVAEMAMLLNGSVNLVQPIDAGGQVRKFVKRF